MLHKLSFQLPADLGKVFPRIPLFWSADHIYSVATKLGPIDTTQRKFSLEELERVTAAASPSLASEMPPTGLQHRRHLEQESGQPGGKDNGDNFDDIEDMCLLEVAFHPGMHFLT
jgi:hypothetical protein